MSNPATPEIRGAEVLLPCAPLAATLEFFTAQLGFRVAAIFPADDPRVAVITGHGLRLRLDREHRGDPGVLVLRCASASPPAPMHAPNGTRIQFVAADPPVLVPPARPSLVVTRLRDAAAWGEGRAGMGYRDLLPGRQGGRFIASHIRIRDGGPVPDYVHYHRVRFQIIYCAAGWVRVVYEDQGSSFVMRPGDCVLQPPGIRHRVLESSPGLEVIEIGCPAEHETLADLDATLPGATLDPQRAFDGQRFVRHEAAGAAWAPWRLPGFAARDTGVAAASDGVGSVQVVRPDGPAAPQVVSHDAELVFHYVLRGALELHTGAGAAHPLAAGDSVALPAGLRHRYSACSADLELLEVSLPARFTTRVHPQLAD